MDAPVYSSPVGGISASALGAREKHYGAILKFPAKARRVHLEFSQLFLCVVVFTIIYFNSI